MEEDRKFKFSELGTKEYWNNFYNIEIENFKNSGDEGECWFGNSFLKKVLNWIQNQNLFQKNETKVLDIGCGNALFLIELAKLNFQYLFGIDYSQEALNLSRFIIDKKDYLKNRINLFKIDILENLDVQLSEENLKFFSKFDIVFDKGTYDAICLNSTKTLKELKDKYKIFIDKVLNHQGIFILCSCNWSKDELINDFQECNKLFKLKLFDEIKDKTFTFAGKIGNTVTCLVFQKI